MQMNIGYTPEKTSIVKMRRTFHLWLHTVTKQNSCKAQRYISKMIIQQLIIRQIMPNRIAAHLNTFTLLAYLFVKL